MAIVATRKIDRNAEKARQACAATALLAAILAVAAGFAATPAKAGLAEAGELEHARANARAGGSLSERDRELLERHGCLSGTRHSFCRSLEGGSAAKPRRKRSNRYD